MTGTWTEEESLMIRKLVSSLVSREDPETVICYHDECGLFFPGDLSEGIFGEREFVDIKKEAGTSEVSDLQLLRSTIGGLIEDLKRNGRTYRDDDLKTMVRFSLGCDIGSMDGLFIRNTRHGRSIFCGKDQIFDLKKGGPVPTKKGGKLLWDLGPGSRGRSVMIEDFVPRGTVFGQGIVEVKGEVHPGDIVIVGHGEDYRGIGRAVVDDRMMLTDIPGPAVQMLSHVRG